MTQTTYNGEILTPGQVAKEWQISVRTIQRYIADGRLKAFRLPGGHARIRRTDATEALQAIA